MRKLLTGEPYAGKPPVRFGGKGDRKVFLTPIVQLLGKIEQLKVEASDGKKHRLDR